jgi:hypothetical protein
MNRRSRRQPGRQRPARRRRIDDGAPLAAQADATASIRNRWSAAPEGRIFGEFDGDQIVDEAQEPRVFAREDAADERPLVR